MLILQLLDSSTKILLLGEIVIEKSTDSKKIINRLSQKNIELATVELEKLNANET